MRNCSAATFSSAWLKIALAASALVCALPAMAGLRGQQPQRSECVLVAVVQNDVAISQAVDADKKVVEQYRADAEEQLAGVRSSFDAQRKERAKALEQLQEEAKKAEKKSAAYSQLEEKARALGKQIQEQSRQVGKPIQKALDSVSVSGKSEALLRGQAKELRAKEEVAERDKLSTQKMEVEHFVQQMSALKDEAAQSERGIVGYKKVTQGRHTVRKPIYSNGK